ncbi:ATP-binding protein [Brevundimonas sp. M20]|uniref:ATP-binding protein n=1 Tax=Brevundimonas sp. M20 TaxID=2591463 RepID=UPI0011475695|nr:ATP-binding protein [Brevundimonas sp. M20]QDH74244.1 ATP-dependent exonuclease SbcCD, C subunit-like protein [Brevundimonas sp. M20]
MTEAVIDPDVAERTRTGMRLERCEVLNWGTFHGHVWSLDLNGDNALLTGDIGSGKSTLVDAVTTLLVPAQKIAYNKAAGAEARERDLRSYVLGYFKSERVDGGYSAKPVGLRDHKTCSVILGRFRNEAFGQDVTLAQVFWFREPQGQPSRFYVVADTQLSITEHFQNFGGDVLALKKRLRALSSVEVHDSFPPYGAAFRRRFGIHSDQALDLFHQTVSMKAVGNLTDFVRQHMLEPFDVEPRIEALIAHFEDLHRAHEAVLKAKAQIEDLQPLAKDCDQFETLTAEVLVRREAREALSPYFAGLKAGLLRIRLEGLEADLERANARAKSLLARQQDQEVQRDEVRRAIADNGGDRLETLRVEIERQTRVRDERGKRAAQYAELASSAGLPDATDADAFISNRRQLDSETSAAGEQEADLQNALTEKQIEFRKLKDSRDELTREVESLRRRRSNIPARTLAVREELCLALNLAETDIPFVGELVEVRAEERAWEGAAERVLHGFALSLLVPDDIYGDVADWVDRTHIGERLVYFRVRERRPVSSPLHPHSLVRKLAVKNDSAFYGWLEIELARRFDYACCSTLEQFRREDRAITRSGQLKAGGERHEKDDRHRLDDRTRYVLGWSNQEKIAALAKQIAALEQQSAVSGGLISQLETKRRGLAERLKKLSQLSMFDDFAGIDWRPIASEIEKLEGERRQLQEGSDALKTLTANLTEIEQDIGAIMARHKSASDEAVRLGERRRVDTEQLRIATDQEAVATDQVRDVVFPRLDRLRVEALGEHKLSIEGCDARERELRDWLQTQIDNEGRRIERVRDRIISAMRAYKDAYPLETRDVDAAIEANGEYRAMLAALLADDLPKFEARFKALLNENTIREVANFQSQLARERETIRERIERINQSLRGIAYNPGRYIVLEAEPNSDIEIRDFQQDLRACTEGALTGSDDSDYSEAKFLQVKRIIERFRGREGSAELDKRWSRKVTDVRSWFVFSASERWREDDTEHEHYADSGGKSGGQKEKLAYTVLAASLAYQFGLEVGASQSRSFHFVLIDEAFGRGSDESTRYGLELFRKLDLQLLIVTPLQKIHTIEPFVAAVGFVHNEGGRRSMLRNLSIEEYRQERLLRTA